MQWIFATAMPWSPASSSAAGGPHEGTRTKGERLMRPLTGLHRDVETLVRKRLRIRPAPAHELAHRHERENQRKRAFVAVKDGSVAIAAHQPRRRLRAVGPHGDHRLVPAR